MIKILNLKTASFYANCQLEFNSVHKYLQLNTLWPVHNLHIKYPSEVNPEILSNWPETDRNTLDIVARLAGKELSLLITCCSGLHRTFSRSDAFISHS